MIIYTGIYIIYLCVSWYVRTLISPSIVVWAIRFVSVIVCIIFCFYWSSWGNLPLQSYWSLYCDHGLHCSHKLMWEQQQQQQQQQHTKYIPTRDTTCISCTIRTHSILPWLDYTRYVRHIPAPTIHYLLPGQKYINISQINTSTKWTLHCLHESAICYSSSSSSSTGAVCVWYRTYACCLLYTSPSPRD